MIHIPGARHRATDCISRHPTGDPEKLILPDDITTVGSTPTFFTHSQLLMAGLCTPATHISAIEDSLLSSLVYSLNSLHLKSVTWDRVHTATTSDTNMQSLVDLIESGMPQFRHELPEPLREYFQFRDSLYTVDGVLLYKDHVVIPPSLRSEVLANLHAAHQGVTSMTARAETSVFWPGITPELQSFVPGAIIAIALPPPIQVHHPPHSLHQLTYSNVSVLITFTTKAATT